MTPEQELDFIVLDTLIKTGYKQNEYVDIITLKEVLRPIIADTTYQTLEGLFRKGYIASNFSNGYALVGASWTIRNSLKRKKIGENADIILKWAVGIIGSGAAILSVVLGLKQLKKQDSTDQLIQDTRILTNQKDSLQRLLENSRTTIQIEPPKPSTKDNRAEDTAAQIGQKP